MPEIWPRSQMWTGLEPGLDPELDLESDQEMYQEMRPHCRNDFAGGGGADRG